MMNTVLAPFHLAIPVKELNLAKAFYCDTLGLQEGRSSDTWVDLNFYGHQLVIHQVDDAKSGRSAPRSNLVDGHDVPVPHFGLILEWDDWHALADRLKSRGVSFVIEPYIRFKGQIGEQSTMFFYDPSGNALEFKSFRDKSQIFAKQ